MSRVITSNSTLSVVIVSSNSLIGSEVRKETLWLLVNSVSLRLAIIDGFMFGLGVSLNGIHSLTQ